MTRAATNTHGYGIFCEFSLYINTQECDRWVTRGVYVNFPDAVRRGSGAPEPSCIPPQQGT